MTIHNHLRLLLLMSSALSGLFGGLAATFAKMLINVLSYYPPPEALFVPSVYLFSFLMLASVLSNLYNLNFAIGLYRQLLVLPPFESSVIFGNLLSGGIIMGEFYNYTFS